MRGDLGRRLDRLEALVVPASGAFGFWDAIALVPSAMTADEARGRLEGRDRELWEELVANGGFHRRPVDGPVETAIRETTGGPTA